MTRDRPILVLGGSGQLGSALGRALKVRGWSFEAPGSGDLDLERTEGIGASVAAAAPRAIVNAAAFTDVARAEAPASADRVRRLNRDAPAELADACRRLAIPLVHVSTDYVFDGLSHRPYREDDTPRPLQVYGRSKLEGERLVLERWPQATVVRTSTLFGPSAGSRPNYVTAILAQARRLGRFEVVRLPVSSPTYAVDLAEAILDLLVVEARGLVHAVNAGSCSRLEFAREIAGQVSAAQVGEKPEASSSLRRPAYSVLDPGRLETLIERRMRPWQAALRDYIREQG